MNCEQLKQHLVDYLYDELSAELRREVESALETCPECATELAELRTVHELAAAVPRLEVSPQVHNNILREARLQASRVTANRERQRFSLAAFFSSPAFASAVVLGLVLSVGLVLSRQGSGPGPKSTTTEAVAALDETELETSPTSGEATEVAAGGEPLDEVTLDGELVAEGPAPAPIETNAAFAPIEPSGVMDNLSRGVVDERALEEQAPPEQIVGTTLDLDAPTAGEGLSAAQAEGAADSPRGTARTSRSHSDDEDASESARDATRRQLSDLESREEVQVARRERERERSQDSADSDRASRSRNEEPLADFGQAQTESRRTTSTATPESPDESPQPAPDHATVATGSETTAQEDTRLPAVMDSASAYEGDAELDDGFEEEEHESDEEAVVAQVMPRAYLAEETSGMDEESYDPYMEDEQGETLNRAWDIPAEQAFADRGRADEETASSYGDDDVDSLATGGSGAAAPAAPPQTSPAPEAVAADRAAAVDPDPLGALYEQGVSRYNDGSYREAVQDFDAFIQAAPSTSNYFSLALYHRALAQMRLGDYGSAIQNLERVISLDPGFERFEDARFRLARAYELDGDFERAEELYRSLAGDSEAYEDRSNEGIDRLRERRRSLYRDEVEASEPSQMYENDTLNEAEKPAVSYKSR